MAGITNDSDYRVKLAKATDFLEAAETVFEYELYDSAVSLAVSAGVNFSDAYQVRRTGGYLKGQDHRSAAVVLQRLGPTGAAMARSFSRLLSLKNKSQYMTARCTKIEAERAIRYASAMQDLVLESS